MVSRFKLSPLLLLVTLPLNAWSWSFSFSNKPTQCGSLTVTVDGGTPPYRLVMVPAGPLVGRPEIRTIIDQEFTETSYTLPPLAFPGNSNFTAIMSDSTGVGTGGTSVITDVATSSDESCLSTETTAPLFYIILPDATTPTQCGSMTVQFTNTQGQVNLWGLIPGGTSFAIDVPAGSNSVSWSPIRVVAGTGIMLVAGDARGRGTGGSTNVLVVGDGDGSCLTGGGGGGGDVTVYSSTPAPYAGGQYATGSGGGTVTGPWNGGNNGSNGSGKGSKTGVIVGAVVGSIALIAIIALLIFLWRRKQKSRGRRNGGTKEIDLLKSDRPGPVLAHEQREQQLVPTPFVNNNNNNTGNNTPTHPPSAYMNGHGRRWSRPSTAGTGATDVRGSSLDSNDPLLYQQQQQYRPGSRSSFNEGTVLSGTTTSDDPSFLMTPSLGHTHGQPQYTHGAGQGAGTGAGLGMSAVAGRQEMSKHMEAPDRLRPVNFVQHEDGGALPIPELETSPTALGPEEVVELPPSYADVRGGGGGTHVSP